jgi:hypothetical protein
MLQHTPIEIKSNIPVQHIMPVKDKSILEVLKLCNLNPRHFSYVSKSADNFKLQEVRTGQIINIRY